MSTESSAELAGVHFHVTDVGPQQADDLTWGQVDRVWTEVLPVFLVSFQRAIGWNPFEVTQEVVEGGLGAFDWVPVTVENLSVDVLRVAVSRRKVSVSKSEIE